MTNSIPNPRFTGIFIPVEILDMKELSPMEMMLLSWIDALYDKEKGGCWASNEYLAERLQVKENSIAKSISHLRSLGLIIDISFDGRTRVIRAVINKIIEERQGWKKIQPCIGEKSNPSIYERKEYIDDDDSRGRSPPFSKDDLYSFAVRTKKDWTTAEIEISWAKYNRSTNKISDPIEYIIKIIDNERINKKNKEEKVKKSCPKNKIPTKTYLEEKSSNTKEISSEKGTSVNLLKNWKQGLTNPNNKK